MEIKTFYIFWRKDVDILECVHSKIIIENKGWDFPGGPVVTNLPCNAGDVGSIPGQGTKIPHAAGERRSHVPWGK